MYVSWILLGSILAILLNRQNIDAAPFRHNNAEMVQSVKADPVQTRVLAVKFYDEVHVVVFQVTIDRSFAFRSEPVARLGSTFKHTFEKSKKKVATSTTPIAQNYATYPPKTYA